MRLAPRTASRVCICSGRCDTARPTRPASSCWISRCPRLSGNEFRRAQLGDPIVATVPIAVMSGAVDAEELAANVGAVATLTKPIDSMFCSRWCADFARRRVADCCSCARRMLRALLKEPTTKVLRRADPTIPWKACRYGPAEATYRFVTDAGRVPAGPRSPDPTERGCGQHECTGGVLLQREDDDGAHRTAGGDGDHRVADAREPAARTPTMLGQRAQAPGTGCHVGDASGRIVT